MGSNNAAWKDQAKEYFFVSHLSIEDVAALTGISRKSVSAFLQTVDGYQEERTRRKAVNAAKRQAYKNNKNRQYRAAAMGDVTPETIRREHDMAAIVLSREKYY